MTNLWNHTQGYGATGPKLAYLTEEQNCRAERVRVARMLWRGQHRRAFLEEGRTQFDFPPLRVQGREWVPYVPVNVLRLVTTTVTDLLLGAEPLPRAADGRRQADVDALVKRSDLHRVFYDATREASWAAEATVEISRYDNEVYVSNLPPGEVFPLGARNPDGQYTAYRRFATATANGETLLLETTYSPGRIERACFTLGDGDGTAKRADVDLAQWPVRRPDGSPLLPLEQTGITWPTIVWMANELDEGRPTSDYDGLIELQDELNHKQTQIARVLAKHADPKMVLHPRSAGPEGNVRADYDVFFADGKEQWPGYLTWNAELAGAVDDRNFTLNALCMAAELSPVLLGIRQGATPDAARKLRLEATKSLARKDRKASFVRPFIRTAIDTAMMMQNTLYVVSVAMPGVSIEMPDGLPVDELDEAQTLNLLTGGKPVMSVERAVERQLPDPAAAAKEIARLQKAQEAATPTVLLGEPAGAAGGGEPGELPAGDEVNGGAGVVK